MDKTLNPSHNPCESPGKEGQLGTGFSLIKLSYQSLLPPSNSLFIVTSCLDKKWLKDALQVALQHKNLPQYQTQSISNTWMPVDIHQMFLLTVEKGEEEGTMTPTLASSSRQGDSR